MTINVTCEITNVIYLNENVLCINLILSSDALTYIFIPSTDLSHLSALSYTHVYLKYILMV